MFQFFSILEVLHPLNEELSSAIFEFGKQINYILVKVHSRACLAKISSMCSDTAFPNLTSYTKRAKQILSVKRISMEL